MYAQPKFRFDITGWVLVELGLAFTTVELYRQEWELAAFEFDSDYRVGLRFPIHYEEGQPLDISLDDGEFDVPDIEPMEAVSGLIDRTA